MSKQRVRDAPLASASRSPFPGSTPEIILLPSRLGAEYLGADSRAVHNGFASVELVGVVQLSYPLLGELVATVHDPTATAP